MKRVTSLLLDEVGFCHMKENKLAVVKCYARIVKHAESSNLPANLNTTVNHLILIVPNPNISSQLVAPFGQGTVLS